MKLQPERALKELQKMDKISKMLHSLLEFSRSVVENQVDDIIERYNEINKIKKFTMKQLTRNLQSEKFLKNNYSMKQNSG